MLDASETRKKHSVALVTEWVGTAVEHSQSQQTYDKAVATAMKNYELAIAGLRHNARVAGGGAHTANKDLSLVQQAVDAVNATKAQSLQQASATNAQSTATTMADHLATIRSQNRNRDSDFAVFGRDWQVKNVNISNPWSNSIANFEYDARGDYIDIQHDFRLDDMQAYLDGLEAMHNRYSSADNLRAWQSLRDARVSEIQRINDERAVAHAENSTERDDQLDDNNEKKATDLTRAQNEYDRRSTKIESGYQWNLNAGPWTGYRSPNISHYGVKTLNAIASQHSYVSLGQQRVALVNQLRSHHAISQVNQTGTYLEVSGYSGHMFDRIGATSMRDLMRYTGNYVGTNIRGTFRSLDSSGFLEGAYSGLVQAAEIRWAWQLGIAQGFANGLNGIQDGIIGIPNLVIGAVNTISYGTSWAINGSGYPEGAWRVPYIPSPDWSKDLFVHEVGSGWTDSHAWSKGLIGAGVELVSGQWLGKINHLGKLNKLDDVPVLTRAANVLDDGARAANHTATKAGDVAKVADKAADAVALNTTVDLMAETGQLGGKLYGPEKLGKLQRYLERRGIYIDPARNGSFDGAKGIMTLPQNPTVLNVRHELSNMLDHKKYGDDYYRIFNQFEREEMVLDRLRNNRIWDNLNEAEQNWSTLYPLTRPGGQTW